MPRILFPHFVLKVKRKLIWLQFAYLEEQRTAKDVNVIILSVRKQEEWCVQRNFAKFSSLQGFKLESTFAKAHPLSIIQVCFFIEMLYLPSN